MKKNKAGYRLGGEQGRWSELWIGQSRKDSLRREHVSKDPTSLLFIQEQGVETSWGRSIPSLATVSTSPGNARMHACFRTGESAGPHDKSQSFHFKGKIAPTLSPPLRHTGGSCLPARGTLAYFLDSPPPLLTRCRDRSHFWLPPSLKWGRRKDREDASPKVLTRLVES